MTRSIFGDITRDEGVLLGFFLLVSVYMFLAAGRYQSTIGLYPRLLSGVVIVCSLLLLFRTYLPARLRAYVAESGGTLGAPNERTGESGQPGSRDPDDSAPSTTRTQIGLTTLIGGYLLLSYLVGMYFATPVFVVTYGVTFGLSRIATAGLVTLSLAISHLFLIVFNAPIGSGVLT